MTTLSVSAVKASMIRNRRWDAVTEKGVRISIVPDGKGDFISTVGDSEIIFPTIDACLEGISRKIGPYKEKEPS